MSAQFPVLTELSLVIGAAAVAAVTFQRARLPIVLGYMVAGLVIGPHGTGQVSDPHLVEVLSELGVILLFFTIGLEFSIRTIARVGLPTLFTAAIEVALVTIVAYAAALALGLPSLHAIFAATAVSISSTMLVVKGLEEHQLTGPKANARDRSVAELIFAIIVVEDLVAILLLAVMTGVAKGASPSAVDIAVTLGKLAGFLVAMVAAGLLIVPRMMRMVARLQHPELLLITSLGVCFVMVWVAGYAEYSVALGAFVAGMLVSESGKGHDVDALVRPFRDVFAAIFFISVGMAIVPADIQAHWLEILVISIVVMIGKAGGVSVAAFLTGNGLRRSVQVGFSLSQIGEFSFILIGVGVATKVIPTHLLSIIAGVSCVTAMFGSSQIRYSGQVASWVDARLPKSISTFVTFYESWVARLTSSPKSERRMRRLRRPVVFLLVDAMMLVAVVIGAAMARAKIVTWLTTTAGIGADWAFMILVGVTIVIAGMFGVGIVNRALQIARLLASQMIPGAVETAELPKAADAVSPPSLDLGRAPRRALVVTIELAIVSIVGLPIAAVIQPFVPGGGIVVICMIGILALIARRSISDFESHVRAGSALIVEVLSRQTGKRPGTEDGQAAPELTEVEALLPGFGGLTPIVIGSHSPAIGRSLADLDLRAKTGASVLAITRGGEGNANPSPRDLLQEGDVLAVAGSAEAVTAARELLVGVEPVSAPAVPAPELA
ncbi:MAG: cation:proton antiporter [Kofleriaceae bacterium]